MAKRALLVDENEAAELRDLMRWRRSLRGAGGIEIRGASVVYRGRKGGGVGGGVDVRVRQLRYKSMANDHIVCRSWDGANEGSEDISVAKPYYLRRTPFHNTTNADGWLLTYSSGSTRTASKSGEDDVAQVIDPPYVSNNLIYAVAPVGGTSLSEVEWQDINADAREWAFDCP